MNGYNMNNGSDKIYGDILTERANSITGLKNGIIWYVCFLPLLGLFLENFAISKWAGIFLWAAVVFIMILCCFLDYRAIRKMNPDSFGTDQLKKWIWLAPVYVYKREKFCMRETYKAIMLGVFCMAAVILNGFTQGLAVHEGNISVLLSNSYVQNLDNFSGSSPNIIGEQLESYLGEDIEWDCTKDGDEYTAVCSGSYDGKKIEVYFVVVHDGFTYQSCKISQIVVDGKVLEGDEYTQAMREIFIPETEEDTSSAEDSSEV